MEIYFRVETLQYKMHKLFIILQIVFIIANFLGYSANAENDLSQLEANYNENKAQLEKLKLDIAKLTISGSRDEEIRKNLDEIEKVLKLEPSDADEEAKTGSYERIIELQNKTITAASDFNSARSSLDNSLQQEIKVYENYFNMENLQNGQELQDYKNQLEEALQHTIADGNALLQTKPLPQTAPNMATPRAANEGSLQQIYDYNRMKLGQLLEDFVPPTGYSPRDAELKNAYNEIKQVQQLTNTDGSSNALADIIQQQLKALEHSDIIQQRKLLDKQLNQKIANIDYFLQQDNLSNKQQLESYKQQLIAALNNSIYEGMQLMEPANKVLPKFDNSQSCAAAVDTILQLAKQLWEILQKISEPDSSNCPDDFWQFYNYIDLWYYDDCSDSKSNELSEETKQSFIKVLNELIDAVKNYRSSQNY